MAVNYCLALFSIYRSKGAREQKVKNKIPSKLDAPDSEKYVYPCTTGYNLEFVNSLNDQWGVVNWTSFPSEGFLIVLAFTLIGLGPDSLRALSI